LESYLLILRLKWLDYDYASNRHLCDRIISVEDVYNTCRGDYMEELCLECPEYMALDYSGQYVLGLPSCGQFW
jgi:hypothetical protein